MSVILGDCLEVMAGMEPESVDAIVTDPPYGLEFMGKEWDKLFRTYSRGSGRPDAPAIEARDGAKWAPGSTFGGRAKQPRCMRCGKLMGRGTGVCKCPEPIRNERREEAGYQMQYWHGRWAEAAYRVAKPSAYLLAFGGTRTVHRMTVALEDAGWIIRDQLMWVYLSGFPKSRASLKPAYEPIVLARKPGPLRDLDIDGCRIPSEPWKAHEATGLASVKFFTDGEASVVHKEPHDGGRWPSNVLMLDDVLGESSRVFVIPKADRADREPVLGGLPVERRTMNSGLTGVSGDRSGRGGKAEPLEMGASSRANVHPTVKPVDLMRHLVRLVTPPGGTVLDPFLGSGTTAIAAEMEGFAWIGIEREAEYVAIAEARLNGVQRGLGLETA